MQKNIGPIIYTFSVKDIREQRIDGFLALFTRSTLASHETAHALLNSVHINFDMGRKEGVVPCELPQVKKFCRRLVAECPVLPWVAGLSTQLYSEVIYSILPEIHVTHSNDGGHEVLFRESNMEKAILQQVGAIRRVGETAKIQPDVVNERVEALTRYLREGVNIL